MQAFRVMKYLVAQILEELRFALLRPLLLFCPSRERRLLGELRKRGVVVIKAYYKASEIESINREIDRAIRPLLATPHPGISTLPGSTRFRRPENESALFKSLSREIYWIGLNALYNGILRYPVLMLSFTEKIARREGAGPPDGGIKFFASHPHFDSYKHEVKVVVALTDVGAAAGPTEIAIASSRYHFSHWREYFTSWLVHQEVLEGAMVTISDELYSKFEVREKLLLAPGDVAIFDSRNVHRATPLVEGKRDLLWFYF